MTNRSPRSLALRRLLPAFLLPLLLLGAACGVAIDDATPTPPPPTAAPEPTPTPDSVLLQDGGVAVVQRAYDRLLDQYIEPVDSSRILDGAWTLLVQAAEEQDLDPPAKPAFTDERAPDFALFRQAFVDLAAQSPDAEALRHASVRGMTEALQDCHTFFLSPVANDTLVGAREGRGTVGIGVDLAGIPPLVTEVVATSPAARAGVAVGDRVVAVDGEDVTGMGPAGAYELLNGEEGTSVTVVVERGDGRGTAEYNIARERVNPPNIEGRLINGVVGYVRVRNFTDEGVAAGLRRTIDDFETQGAVAWVLDIRGNPGGRLDVGAMSLFVRRGSDRARPESCRRDSRRDGERPRAGDDPADGPVDEPPHRLGRRGIRGSGEGTRRCVRDRRRHERLRRLHDDRGAG